MNGGYCHASRNKIPSGGVPSRQKVFTPWGMNSGVMYINVANASQYADPLIDFAEQRG